MKNVLIVWVLLLAGHLSAQIHINLHVQTLDGSGMSQGDVPLIAK